MSPGGAGTLGGRTFLFLQGAATPFHRRLALALEGEGARIAKVQFCGGDVLFWRRPATPFRGGIADWPQALGQVLAAQAVTDVVLFGDCRPHHAVAVAEARRRGLRLHLFEEGYLRPGWITCESWGVNGHSDLPQHPAEILALAQALPAPAEALPVPAPFLNRAAWDVLWTAGLMALAPLYPCYRHHALDHPLVEYAGWVTRFVTAPVTVRRARRLMRRLADAAGHYYLHPLQLDTDFQIRVHSPYGSTMDAAREVIASFARYADCAARLVVKLHPLDVRPTRKRRAVAAMAAEHGVADRVDFIDGGDLDQLVDDARGVVVVNSTVGMMALGHGRPVKVLGTAVFDVAGLTFQDGLDRFWADAAPPQPALLDAFRRVVVARTQIPGGFFSRAGLDLAVAGACRRIVEDRVRPLAVRIGAAG